MSNFGPNSRRARSLSASNLSVAQAEVLNDRAYAHLSPKRRDVARLGRLRVGNSCFPDDSAPQAARC